MNLLSRKFVLSMCTLLITSTLCYLGSISDGVYSTVIIATVGAYITGNVLQKNQPTNEKKI